jgi:hypothetical protein
MKMKHTFMMVAVVGCIGMVSTASATLINNGSFETGDFSGWITQDLASPHRALTVRTAGYLSGYGFFTTTPTAGSYTATHGFDGGGPGTIRIGQDVLITPGQTSIKFDYRVAWDMANYGGVATADRLFNVTVEVAGGGAQLASYNILTAVRQTQNLDTGNLVGQVDLSSFSGQTIRLNFDAYIPESFTGPGYLQLDNIHAIPEPASMALFGLFTTGIWLKRRFFVG